MKLQQGLKRMKSLEIKEKEFLQDYNQILEGSGMGQLPYVGDRALDKAFEVNKKRVRIWNEIRSTIIYDGKSLWQIAIQSKLFVVRSGKEELLQFGMKEIEEMLRQKELQEARNLLK